MKVLYLCVLMLCSCAASIANGANIFSRGDLFISVSNGQVQWRGPDGTLKATLDTQTASLTNGLAFDASDNLYVASQSGRNPAVSRFDPSGNLLGTFGGPYNAGPESIQIDTASNVYVGQADGTHQILKFSNAGTLSAAFNVAVENRGSDWIWLESDQCTMYYTSEGPNVKAYNVCTSSQLPNYNLDALPDTVAYGLLGTSSGLLVANTHVIVRLVSGRVVQIYDAPGEDCWLSLAADIDGSSFWAGDFCTSDVYKFDIASGQVLQHLNTGSAAFTVFGVAINQQSAGCPVPMITLQPQDQTVPIGNPATLSVTATGSGLQYQWYTNNAAISGATQSTYATGPLTSTTSYYVVVSNACGSVTSRAATITVNCTPPAITMQQSDASITTGSPVTVSVGATGTGLRYQWYQDGFILSGATGSSYTSGALKCSDPSKTCTTTFYVVVTGQCGNPVQSRTATITITPVCTAPTVVIQPQSQAVVSGTSATLSVTANGPALQYQWMDGGLPITGATSSTYTTPPLTSEQTYTVQISNSCGATNSNIAAVEVDMLTGSPGTPLNPTGTFAEPVNTATGAYLSSHLDLRVKGRGTSFKFIRRYNSSNPYSGPLGPGWTHSYNIFLSANTTTKVATINEADGGQVFFLQAADGSYSPFTPGLTDKLVKNANGSFILTTKDQMIFAFSAGGQLLSITDRNGNAQVLSYSSGNLTSVADTVGRTFTFTYDGNHRLLSITDPANRAVQYSYDANGNLSQYQDALGGKITYSYDSAHRITAASDARGVTYVQNTYDTQGRVVTQKNGRGFPTNFAYNTPVAGTTTITDALANTTEHIYDGHMRLVQIADAQSGTTTSTYDTQNRRTSVKRADGNTTSFTYDPNGNLTSITDPLSNTWTFVYAAQNNILSSKSPRGKVTSFGYEGSGNVTSVKDALGNSTVLTYDSFGEITSVQNAAGNSWSYSYDGNGNLVQTTNPAGKATRFSYDAISRLTSVTDANGHTSSTMYDLLSRPIKRTNARGNTIQYAYDVVGNLIQLTNANGKPTGYQYDEDNNLIAVTDALSHTTTYFYDADDNRTSLKNARGNTTAYAYDSLNRRTKVTDPLGLSRTVTYAAVGDILSLIDASGKTQSFTYDPLGRRLSSAYSDGTSVSYTYDADGNRISMVDSHGTTTYTYDDTNRLATVIDPSGRMVKYTYNSIGRRSTLTYPDGRVLNYMYDVNARLSQVMDWAGRSSTYAYDDGGNLVQLQYGNGVSTQYARDAGNRLTSVLNSSPAGPLSHFSYVLDAIGNRTQMTDLAGGIFNYSYDDLNRLIAWASPSGQFTTYSYDAVGNRTVVAGAFGATVSTYDAADELLSSGLMTFTYDGNGNRVTKNASGTLTVYTYDSRNLLTSVSTSGTTETWRNDGDDTRVAMTTAAGTVQYANDVTASNHAVLAEMAPSGVTDYQYGLSLLSASSPSFDRFYQTDALRSTTTVTDASATLKANYSYDPWGKMLNPIDPLRGTNAYKFAGQAIDAFGLSYNNHRVYDSQTGTFLSRDPFPGFASIPVSENGYAYAADNPVNLVDPSGFASEPVSSDENPTLIVNDALALVQPSPSNSPLNLVLTPSLDSADVDFQGDSLGGTGAYIVNAATSTYTALKSLYDEAKPYYDLYNQVGEWADKPLTFAKDLAELGFFLPGECPPMESGCPALPWYGWIGTNDWFAGYQPPSDASMVGAFTAPSFPAPAQPPSTSSDFDVFVSDSTSPSQFE